MSRIMAMGEQGVESGPASSSGSVPHSPSRQQHQEASPGYSPGSAPQGSDELPSSQTSEGAHYHKETGGDAVSVYPKEMAETPALVYHKQVGGHSVSIYPKDVYLQAQAQAAAQAAQAAQAAHVESSSSSYSAIPAITSSAYPASPAYPSSPLPSSGLHHQGHGLSQTHATHSD